MTEAEILAWVKAHKSEIVRNVIAGRTPKDNPVAIIMAGLPGSGKTEFLNHVIEEADYIVIDLDDLATRIYGYQPGDYYKYRRPAGRLVSAVLDKVNHRKINFALDGTFCHKQGIFNIERALKHGFEVNMFLIDQDPAKAWEFAEARRKLTGRSISRTGFIATCHSLIPIVREATEKFSDSSQFYMNIVQKNDLSKAYTHITDPDKIAKRLESIYNLYKDFK